MTDLSREELAARAGVTPDYVDRLVDLGIIKPNADGVTFSIGALRAARMVQAFERGGLPLDGIGAAVTSGQVSFDFLTLPAYERFSSLSDTTFRAYHERRGMPLELLLTMREAIGFARPEPDDLLRDVELQIAPGVQMTFALGLDVATAERFLHVYLDNLRRIVESESDWYRTYAMAPLVRGGMRPAEAFTTSTQISPKIAEVALLGVYHALQEQTWTRTVFEVMESEMERAGLWTRLDHLPAVSFLDLSGFTRLTEERGDAAAAELSATLGRSAQRIARAHGGTPVKWLGDGVMFRFDEPSGGVVASLEMVEEMPAAGLPPARVGIDAGPVFFQDGDYFGRTVNVAARIAAYARAGEVLVSDRVLEVGPAPGCRFEQIGPTELKGVADPVVLHHASRG